MTRAAYFECFAGASGDMILGALVDAGWSEHDLRDALASVPVSGWELHVRRVKKGALRATQVRIDVDTPQPERTVRDIEPLIERSRLDTAVKARAISLFHELADVEGIEHDQPADEVHFHEVGAVDSILDIVGACAGLHALGIERIYVSPINVGGGIVPTRDGILPVPGPAALELLKRKGAPIYASEYGPEFLTPTGALVLATLADGFGPFPAMRVEQIGYGAGHKDFRIPNVLRVSLGELDHGWRRPRPLTPLAIAGAHSHETQGHEHAPAHDHQHERASGTPEHGHDHASAGAEEDVVVQLETNIDDMNPEWYGHLADRLYDTGALDVTLIPAYMKKGRPGTLVSVLVHPDAVEPALAALFSESTTLGVRIAELARRTLPRRVETVETAYGQVRVKLSLVDGAVRRAAPEYDDCRAAAARHGVPLQHIYDAATQAAAPLLAGS